MIEKYIQSEYGKRAFSKTEMFYLLFLLAGGALIRFIYHYDRPFVGDEVATLIQMQKSATYILTQFEPWLTMNYFILAEKYLAELTGGSQWSLILLPEIAGIATIPLTALLAKKFTSNKTALVAATLIAFNPYLIYYSGNIRSYSLLAAFSLWTLILFFNWCSNRTFRNGIYVALAGYGLMLSHPNGAYTLAYIFSLAGIELFFFLARREKNNILTLVIPVSVMVVITFFSYISIAEDLVAWGIPWHNDPPTSISYIFFTFASYFGAGFYGWVSAFFMFLALFLAIRRQNNPILILAPFIVLSILLISIQGVSHFPEGYSRFLIFLTPVCVIFIAEGVVRLSAMIPAENRMVLGVITLGLILTWYPNFSRGYREKISLPWEKVADFIKQSAEGTTILSGDWAGNLNLTPYFSDSSYARFELRKYTAELHAPAGKSIYYIATGLGLKSEYPVHAFGDIRVVVYPAADFKEQMRYIQHDLLRIIPDFRVTPGLTDTYKNLWFLNKILDNDPELNFKYYDLYMRSSQLSGRQKNIPLSLKTFELKSAGYNVDM